MIKIKRGEAGFTFVEVLIAICILMLFSSTLFTGLQVTLRAVMKADGMATAEAIAKTEIEFIQMQDICLIPVGIYTAC